jgi:hypothetical protein
MSEPIVPQVGRWLALFHDTDGIEEVRVTEVAPSRQYCLASRRGSEPSWFFVIREVDEVETQIQLVERLGDLPKPATELPHNLDLLYRPPTNWPTHVGPSWEPLRCVVPRIDLGPTCLNQGELTGGESAASRLTQPLP